MGVIVNPRGPSGSGKTELARRILARYGPVPQRAATPTAALARILAHPAGGRPLAVIGRYDRTSGGCDTIRLAEGGLAAAFDLADRYAGLGFDVLMEGNRLSFETERTADLARRRHVVVIGLDTPPLSCARNLVRRRRRGSADLAALARRAAAERAAFDREIARLGAEARVSVGDFDEALRTALALLGLVEATAACPRRPPA